MNKLNIPGSSAGIHGTPVSGEKSISSGKVSSFNEITGTGFIVNDEIPGVIKFTYKDIRRLGYRMVHEGQTVNFELHLTARGPWARDIIPDETEHGR